MTTIAVLGPGAVGGFLAGALARASQDVLVVARRPSAAVIEGRGLSVSSVRLGEFTVRVRAVAALRQPVGVLLVATKAAGLEAALARIEAAPQLVIPLLNGLDHMTLLRRRLGSERVAAGAIRVECDSPALGSIVQTSPFLRVDLAADEPALHPHLCGLAGALERAGIPARLGPSEAQILWSKLARLVSLALTTSAYDAPIGAIRTERRQTLQRCVAEAAAAANADGARIDPAWPLQELDDAHPGLGSSMRRDIAAGREPELDAIAGAVLRAGRRHGLECPTIARLAQRVAARAGIQPPVW